MVAETGFRLKSGSMHYRKLGKTNFNVSEVSLGAWQIGGGWGDVPDTDAQGVLHSAIKAGINFIDTADVYGDGRSERFIAKVLSETKTPVFVATKAGRRFHL
jgi:aryl-alcohol dehydrogenase-like predicted oxidoreductase